AGHFQHFLEGDAVQAAGGVHHARVGGVNAIHVGVNLALISVQRGGQGHRCGVGTATAQGGNVVVVVHALETGDHHHPASVQVGAYLALVDVLDTGLGVAVIGADRHLPAGVGTR